MPRLTLSLSLLLITVLFASCSDQVVSLEDSARHEDASSATATESFMNEAVTRGQRPSPELRKEVARLRRATASYQDVDKAVEDGYLPASPFVPGMGFHYVNGTLVGDDNEEGELHIDVSPPDALVYDSNDPQREMRNLGAVEYIIPDPLEELSQEDLPILFTGQTAEDWHYEDEIVSWTLHVWIWLNNPEGLFHSTNPRVDHGAPTP